MTNSETAVSTEPPRRSLLFVPGKRIEIYPKAVASQPDIVCIDLEDALAADDKEYARSSAVNLCNQGGDRSVETVIRINTVRSAFGLADFLAVRAAESAPAGIMIPKVTEPEEIRILEDALEGRHPHMRFHAWIENARGLAAAEEIANASPRLASLSLGGYDMAADLRIEPSWDTLLHARSRLVTAAAGADIDLLDSPYFGLDNLQGLKAETEAVRRLGFTGKTAIHPKQIEIINQVFTPTAEQVDRARELITAYESQTEAFFVHAGEILEAPVIKRYYRTLAIAERAGL